MGTVHVAISAGVFIIEVIIQLSVVGAHSQHSEALFVILLAIVMAPLILINFVSAIQVTRTQDFSGKTCGRILCIAFHSIQLGIVWRSLKLLILFDKKDWQDYIKMRLFHGGFQSIPFCIVLAYSMFILRTNSALDILAIILSLLSASVSFSIFRVSNVLDASNEAETDNDEEDASMRCNAIRKHVGVVLLVFSTSAVIFSRCASIVLFTVVQPYWIALPLSLHFIFHVIKGATNRLKCNDDKILTKILKIIYTSFVNIFDMVGRDYSGVKCSYVFYYTIMLIENLVFSFYWMLTSEMEERSKLYAVVVVLLCFIIGMIVKFTSCGCIFNIESDILSDAFSNPELQGEKKTDKEMDKGIETVTDDVTFHEICHDDANPHSDLAMLQDVANFPSRHSKHHSKRGSSTTSSNSRLREYDNQAFVRSHGNISFNSQQTSSSRKQAQDEGDNVSFEYRTISQSSQENSHSSRERSHRKTEKRAVNRKHSRSPNKRSHSKGGHSKSKRSSSVQRADIHGDNENRIPMIIVSDISKHAQQMQVTSGQSMNSIKVRNADMASSHSKYSRNTNTLNGSVQNYKYNGFDDPFRERRQYEISARKHLKHNDRHVHHDHHYHRRHQKNRRNRPNMDYSLDSSELYPSMTSDSSSMTSYTDTNEQLWRKHRQRIQRRNRHLELRDGYSTDVSNSDNLSYNDYSMEDSSSWSGSSSSSSDGAATWPPRHTANLLKVYNLPDKESSAENIMHWLETMETEASDYDSSFSVANEQPLPSDTDISLSAMQTFEIKKEKKKFKRMISKPKGLLLKFSSLNYKRRDNGSQNRPYPLKQNNPSEVVPGRTEINTRNDISMNSRQKGVISDSSMPLPVDSVQESIV